MTIRSQHTDLDNYIGHKTHGLPSLQTKCMSLDWQIMHFTRIDCILCVPVAPRQGPLLGRNPPPWTKQLVLSWSRIPQARLGDTWAHLGSHIYINAFDSIFFQSNGPKPWYGHLVGNLEQDIRMSGQGHQNIRWSTNTAPTLVQDVSKYPNLEEF